MSARPSLTRYLFRQTWIVNKSAGHPVEVGDKKLALDEAYQLSAETDFGFCTRRFHFTPNPRHAPAAATAAADAPAAPAHAPASRTSFPRLCMLGPRNNLLTLRSHPPKQQRAGT